MGYIRHHAIVVTGMFPDIEMTRSICVQIAKKHGDGFHGDMGDLVGPVIESTVNSYGSFFVAPDGSKEGWDESASGDNCRTEIIKYLESLRYSDGSTCTDYAEVQFGDDDKETKVLRQSDNPEYGQELK